MYDLEVIPSNMGNEEKNLIMDTGLVQGGESLSNLPWVDNITTEILRKTCLIQNNTQLVTQDLRRMEQRFYSLATTSKVTQDFQSSSVDPNALAELLKSSYEVAEKLTENVMLLIQLQEYVLNNALLRWKSEQQLTGNGANFKNNLDTIQEWCENLAELIWANRRSVKEFEILEDQFQLYLSFPEKPILRDLLAHFTQLLCTLITSTFIIEEQPPQVIKRGIKFGTKVRSLVGAKFCSNILPQVKATIVSESQANNLLKDSTSGIYSESSGEILNNSGAMQYQPTTKQLSVTLRNMLLKSIKRSGKTGTLSVMDEKFTLLLQSQISIDGEVLLLPVKALSLPVVIVVHGIQEPQAWATITWDNAFSEPGRDLFSVPNRVPWRRVEEVLSMKFKAATGKPLTEDNLKFLAEKVLPSGCSDTSSAMLSWAQFCKEPLRGVSFTFWDWFYAVMKLTKDHLKELWNDNLIMGFVKKNQAEDILTSCTSGTFLLRFSDSELGGITIAWISECGEVVSIQPFTSKDLGIRTLADHIRDLDSLVQLYSNVPKDIAFGKYYTACQGSRPASKKGYVPLQLMSHVPGYSGRCFTTTSQHLNSPNSLNLYNSSPSVDSQQLQSACFPSNLGTSAYYTENRYSDSIDVACTTASYDYNMNCLEFQPINDLDLTL